MVDFPTSHVSLQECNYPPTGCLKLVSVARSHMELATAPNTARKSPKRGKIIAHAPEAKCKKNKKTLWKNSKLQVSQQDFLLSSVKLTAKALKKGLWTPKFQGPCWGESNHSQWPKLDSLHITFGLKLVPKRHKRRVSKLPSRRGVWSKQISDPSHGSAPCSET